MIHTGWSKAREEKGRRGQLGKNNGYIQSNQTNKHAIDPP
jgi:hypothetical protein